MKPVAKKGTPGEVRFLEDHNRAINLAKVLPTGTKLIYTGPNDYRFIDWHPLPHGDRVTVIGRCPGKTGVKVQFSDGAVCGINLWNLAFVPQHQKEV